MERVQFVMTQATTNPLTFARSRDNTELCSVPRKMTDTLPDRIDPAANTFNSNFPRIPVNVGAGQISLAPALPPSLTVNWS